MQQWNAKILFPADSDYSNRVLTAKYGPSNSSGNPMITLVMEVVSPQSKNIAGVDTNIAGCKTTNYYTVTSFNEDGSVNDENTKNCRERITKLYTDFGLEAPTDFNAPLDVKGFEKKVVLTQMRSKITEQRKTPTAEQAAKKQQGDVMKHPVTGKPLIQYWPEIVEIFGLAPEGQVAVGGGAGY